MEQGSSLEKEPLLPPPLPGAAERRRLYSGTDRGDLEDDGHCCVSVAASPRSGGPGETRDYWECLLGWFSVPGRNWTLHAGRGGLAKENSDLRRRYPKPGLDQNESSRGFRSV